MNVTKEAGVGTGQTVDEEALAQINTLSQKVLTKEEVFSFSVRLCDNEIDRDYERFSQETLDELAVLFVGKSGVFDHQWSAKGQAARIYCTEIVREDNVLTEAGDAYRYLKGNAYMLRTEGNRDLIAEIEGGIKKEVSIGCAVSAAICAVCGEDMNQRTDCAHVKGRTYNGKLCWAELRGVTDAYEWSFVAVPAQRKAGVIKNFGGERPMELRKAAEQWPGCLAELDRLEGEAELGRNYLEGLRKEVTRLGGLAEPGMRLATLGTITAKLAEPELLELRKHYESRLNGTFPVGVQLTYRAERRETEIKDGAFLI